MPSLKVFDAFPKTQQQHVKKSLKGSIASIMLYFFLLFIAWSELGSYFGGYIDEQYIVDDHLQKTAQINMDMFVKTPCKYLEVSVRDITKDQIFASQMLMLRPMHFYVPPGVKVNDVKDIETADIDDILADAIPAQFRSIEHDFMDENINANGCRISGSITVNKVKGELRITEKPRGNYGLSSPSDMINFSHVINEFSFGEFFPFIDNTLDEIACVTEERWKGYYYFASVVPTIYNKMGARIDTNQYSVSREEKTFSPISMGRPGIFIRYNFEALSVVVKDQRIGFWQFIIRLVSIMSFVVYIATLAFRFFDWTLVSLLGPRWSLRSQTDQVADGILG